MVEINNQRKCSSICWRGQESSITDVRNQKSWLRCHCRRWDGLYRLLRSPSQTCHAKPKIKINRRWTLPASFLLAGCLPQVLGRKTFRKVRTLWRLQQIGDACGALMAIDRGDIRQANRPLQQYSGPLPGAGYGQFEHKAEQPDCKIQRSGRNGQRDWCMSRVTAIIPPGYLHHRLPVMGC